jgi:CRISPR/Cas system CSM-associated protein Csm3 (group 7 of RAMP superfamily)
MEHRTVSINKTLVAQELRGVDTVPAGFKFVETDFISVRHAKDKEEVIKIL